MTILRALTAGLKLPARPPFSAPGAGTRSLLSGLLSANALDGMAAYAEVGAVHGPTRRICESVALVDWQLYQQTITAGSVDRALIDDATPPARHPATALWIQPNGFMSRRSFLFLSQLYQETAGGVYWLVCARDEEAAPFAYTKQQPDIELWPIPKRRITPVPDPDRYLAGYVYTVGNVKIPLAVENVIPLGWPDPRDPLRFTGPLQALAVDIESEKYAVEYQRNTFLNNAEPGGVIEFDLPLEKTRFEEIVLRWREQHQGVANAKRVAILEQGHWKDVAQSNRDLQYEALRHLTREQVMFARGMPFAMMQSNDINLANALTGERLYARYTLRPALEAIKEAINQALPERYGPMLTFGYDLPAPEDEAFDVYAGTTGWLSGLLSKNEGRAALGYDAIPDGDVYVSDLTGVVPTIPPPKPPKRPTTLGLDDVPMRQVRCPECRHLLAKNANVGAELWCGRCRAPQIVGAS